MERRELTVQIRKDLGKSGARRLRKKGFIPGILYGPTCDPVPLTIPPKALKMAIDTDAGWNTLITLTVEGNEDLSGKVVMLRDVQIDPLDGSWIHADLYDFPKGKKIHVEVPIHIKGKAKGVEKGGILQVAMRKLEILAQPTSIPQSLDVVVDSLDIGDSLHLRDLTFPKGVECDVDPDTTVVSVVAPISEEELKKMEETAAAGEMAEPEVVGEKGGAEKKEAPAKEGEAESKSGKEAKGEKSKKG